jgi:protein-S-isoprenylcysteine O-methyltransferase Ste14
MSARMTILAVLLTIIAVAQIVLAIVLYDDEANDMVRNAGWGILWLSAVLGWLPMITLRRSGGVAKGKSYVHTTQVVDRGLYAVVRHPQYLAGILLAIALPLIAQHWIVGLLGVGLVAIYYVNTFDEERGAVEKFGDEYTRYAQRVPRLNLLRGVVRLVRRRTTK